MAWTTLHLQVVTPLFSGDDPDPKAAALIRVPSVRGALRYWLRAVIAGRGLVGQEDLLALWAAEECVLGSTRKPSPIALRIRRQPRYKNDLAPAWTGKPETMAFVGARYLLGQGLWKHDVGLKRRYVPAGAEFDLDVRFSGDDAVDGQFMVALWAWLTYGGLGARTRRGFGQLACIAVAGDPPLGLSAVTLARPERWEEWERLGRETYPQNLSIRDSGLSPDLRIGGVGPVALAEHPALDQRWWKGSIVRLNAKDLGDALHRTGLRWRRFRAGPDAPMDKDRLPFAGTHSPEWTDVIHGPGSSYPVGALGLPVNYFSKKDKNKDAFKATVTPAGDLRRASPVWLRPVQLNDEKWHLFTFYFISRLLPMGVDLDLTSNQQPSELLTPPGLPDAQQTWTRWLNGDPRLPPGTNLRAP